MGIFLQPNDNHPVGEFVTNMDHPILSENMHQVVNKFAANETHFTVVI